MDITVRGRVLRGLGGPSLGMRALCPCARQPAHFLNHAIS